MHLLSITLNTDVLREFLFRIVSTERVVSSVPRELQCRLRLFLAKARSLPPALRFRPRPLYQPLRRTARPRRHVAL